MKTVPSLLTIIVSMALVSGLISACALSPDNTGASANASLSEASVNHQQQISPCGSMPPIKDRSKLKQHLLDRRLIKEEMSPEEVDRVVGEYISKRQQAFEYCPKKR